MRRQRGARTGDLAELGIRSGAGLAWLPPTASSLPRQGRGETRVAAGEIDPFPGGNMDSRIRW